MTTQTFESGKNRHAPVLWAAVIALALGLLPFVVKDSFTLQVLLLAIMFGALGASWNLVGGFLGRVSFGHGVFIGSGAYTTLLLLHYANVSPLIGIPLGGLISALLAWVVGGPTLRL